MLRGASVSAPLRFEEARPKGGQKRARSVERVGGNIKKGTLTLQTSPVSIRSREHIGDMETHLLQQPSLLGAWQCPSQSSRLEQSVYGGRTIRKTWKQ